MVHSLRLGALTLFLAAVVLGGCADSTLPVDSPRTEAEIDGFPDPMLDVTGGTNLAAFTDVGSYDAAVPNAWYQLAYDITKTELLSPPLASRNFGYTGVSLYEALTGGMPGYQTLVGQLNELYYVPSINPSLEYHWPTVANTALARVLWGLFDGRPVAQASIRALHDEFAREFRPIMTLEVYRRSAMHGRAVAKAILAWARHDGFSTYNNCSYTPPVGEGLWVPTPPAYAPALQPCWGQMRTSVVPDGSFSDPGAHPVYSETPGDPFYVEAEEVYNTVANLTQEQLDIALYWADNPGATGTPPGHSISICRQIIEQEGIMLDGAAEAYAKVGLAVHDAFINCWWSKYEYNLLRPVTYIRSMWAPDWLPPVGTPPFPEYTSGHSVQSGASAQVMYDMWGDVQFTDHTHDALGYAPRSFNTFFEAAEEAAISRLYGGIHYRSAIELGVAQGTVLGEQVSALIFSTTSKPVAVRSL